MHSMHMAMSIQTDLHSRQLAAYIHMHTYTCIDMLACAQSKLVIIFVGVSAALLHTCMYLCTYTHARTDNTQSRSQGEFMVISDGVSAASLHAHAYIHTCMYRQHTITFTG